MQAATFTSYLLVFKTCFRFSLWSTVVTTLYVVTT